MSARPFSDGVISIRRIKQSDVQQLYEATYESIDDLRRWMPWCHPDYTIKETIEFVRSRSEAWDTDEERSLVIVDHRSGDILGGCGLNRFDRDYACANLGYWVRTSAAGRGIGTAATRLLARYAFEKEHLHRVEILVAAGNLASQRVAEKAGATREGVLRDRLNVWGMYHDAVLYSLLATDERQGATDSDEF